MFLLFWDCDYVLVLSIHTVEKELEKSKPFMLEGSRERKRRTRHRGEGGMKRGRGEERKRVRVWIRERKGERGASPEGLGRQKAHHQASPQQRSMSPPADSAGNWELMFLSPASIS